MSVIREVTTIARETDMADQIFKSEYKTYLPEIRQIRKKLLDATFPIRVDCL